MGEREVAVAKAYDLSCDEIAEFLATDEGAAFLDRIDAKWDEAIGPMREAGFIVVGAEGSVMACTYATVLNASEAEGADGIDAVARMLQMNGVELPIGGE